MNQPGYIICIWEFNVKRKGRVTLSVKTFTLSDVFWAHLKMVGHNLDINYGHCLGTSG